MLPNTLTKLLPLRHARLHVSRAALVGANGRSELGYLVARRRSLRAFDGAAPFSARKIARDRRLDSACPRATSRHVESRRSARARRGRFEVHGEGSGASVRE